MDITHFWNLAIVDPLIGVLQFLAGFTGSGGLAIILMTLLIKTILLPLSLKQTASMKAMQALQPELAAIRKKYKDREKVTQETMRLYKERGVNPASGCLPMIPTMIVLIGLYSALQQLAQHDPEFQQPFLWVPRLDHPDVVHIGELALPGILPIAMAITQYFSSKMMTMPSADPQQASINRMTTIIMPAMMLFWGITFPAGLVLYWFVSNVFEMVRLYFTMGASALNLGPLLPRGAASEPTVGDGEAGALTAQDSARSEIAGGEARTESRPARPRQKRGKRSGRR